MVLYDLRLQQVLKVMSGHETMVNQLCYLSNYGGILVSVGFEHVARVWQIGQLCGENFLGRLKGHASLITSVVSLPNQSYVVTIDEN